MREVSVRILHFSIDLARAGGVDEKALFDGLSSVVPVDGKHPDWFDWDDLVTIIERLEGRVGGPEGMGRVMREAAPIAYPEIRAFASVFIRPIPAFKFVMTRLISTMYRNIKIEEIAELGDNRVRWRQTIPPAFRESAAFHRSTKHFVELFPRHLDLPAARVVDLEITPRSADFVVEFPPTDSLTARGARAVSSAASVLAVQLDEAFALMGDMVRAGPAGSMADAATFGATITTADAGWAERLALSPRQRDVFALLVEGRANKDIAGTLRCSERNVEFHVGRILRAAGVSSRAELLVKVLGARA